MIREKKSEKIPSSLLTTQRYDGEDVKTKLLEDQHNKCYICERRLGTDFQVEHLKSREGHNDLRQKWSNLFMACSYCNGKKSDLYDNNVCPIGTNVENEIRQRIDFTQNKASFTTTVDDEPHRNTVGMLLKLYNGKRNLRNIKETIFFNETKQEIINFSRKINNFLTNSTPENRVLVANELSIDKSMLGFKYWIICDNHLDNEFKDEIKWNKE